MELSHNHSFAPDEARERVRALGDYLQNKHGMTVQWTGPDSVHIAGKYTVVAIDVQVRVEPNRVFLQGKDPGMLLRGTAKKYVAGKLEKYLDPQEPVASLPRN